MVSITIEMPDSHVVETRRGAKVTADVTKLVALAKDYLVNGINQDTRDSASSAARLACVEKFGADNVGTKLTDVQRDWVNGDEGTKVAMKHEQALMDKCLEARYAGNWTQRGTGVTRDDRTAAIVNVFAAMLESADRKRFAKLSFRERLEAANANDIDEKLISAEVARLEAAREAKAEREAAIKKAAKKIKINF